MGRRTGHKEIIIFMMQQFNVSSWRTVMRWRESGMPFHRQKNGKPYVIEEEVVQWQLKNNQ